MSISIPRPLKKLAFAAAALTATLGLGACADGYGYGGGYGGVGIGAGYANAAWDPYYGGYAGDPYWGWNNDFYYPGTGYYVFDRSNRRYRWNAQQRGYWQGRAQGWRSARREIRPMWRDYGVRGRPGGGRAGYGSRGFP
ncbi:MAG: hypothetical protein EOP89_07700, partial [Lysobacteraceae bacterium]